MLARYYIMCYNIVQNILLSHKIIKWEDFIMYENKEVSLETKNAAMAYFRKATKKCFIVNTLKQGHEECFQDFLDKHYKNYSLYYSAYAIMGMNPEDILVRGKVKGKKAEIGWIEMDFQGDLLVFDFETLEIRSLDEFYEIYQPQVTVYISQKEILDKYLSSERAVFDSNKNCYLIKNILEPEDIENGTYMINRSKIQMEKENGKVTKFVAFEED